MRHKLRVAVTYLVLDNRQQVDYLSLLNDMLTDESKQANDSEKADLVVRVSTKQCDYAELIPGIGINYRQLNGWLER